MITTDERTNDIIEQRRRIFDAYGEGFRVAAPGIIQSVDDERQTCTVQLAIRKS